MELDVAQLSSLASTLGGLTERVTTLADELESSPREGAAADLYEVERSLKEAHRRLLDLVRRVS